MLNDLEANWTRRWEPEVRSHLAFWDAFDLSAAATPELVEHLDAAWERLRALWRMHCEIVIPLGRAIGEFTKLYDELFEPDAALRSHDLLRGGENLTTLAARRLWAPRHAMFAMPGAADLIASIPHELAATLAGEPSMRPITDALKAWLAEFGDRVPSLSPAIPTLAEDPTPVARMLKKAVTSEGPSLEERHAWLAAERGRATDEARTTLRAYPCAVREAFEQRLDVARTAMLMVDDHNYLIDYASTGWLRRVVRAVGTRLADDGVPDAPGDVVNLYPDEMRDTLVRPTEADPRPRVDEPKSEMRRYASVAPPPTVGTPSPDRAKGAAGATKEAAARRFARDGLLTGAPGSSGVAIGRARVVRTLADADRLEHGEILVAPTTAQPWVPLFGVAAALITETGGTLNHAAIVAREFHLPAVVGVPSA
ncbi:MAG: PEP-utilizing enzyme, partial [Trueperaceae bacterium]|nr:PEP-utilizing enzyme [Trueperaceae bacterium]